MLSKKKEKKTKEIHVVVWGDSGNLEIEKQSEKIRAVVFRSVLPVPHPTITSVR